MKGIPALDEGLALYNAGRFEAAVERFRRVLRDPGLPGGVLFPGPCLGVLRPLKEAEKVLRHGGPPVPGSSCGLTSIGPR